MNKQIKYLQQLIGLGYSRDEAMASWQREKNSTSNVVIAAPAKRKEILSGQVELARFTEYQRNLLDKDYWADLIKGLHIESFIGHFNSVTSTEATAADALMKIIAEKKIKPKYYPLGHPNEGQRKLRDQWKALIDSGWDWLNFNPLAMNNHSDGIKGKSVFEIVSQYLQFVINDLLLQKFDQAFKDSEPATKFYKGL